MPPVRQTNFGSGELAPGLWGRTDLEKYASGLRRCRNFFLNRQGAAVSRPGTQYVAELKGSGPWRLIPFVYSDEQTYVLEFGHLYVRFHADGATVESAPDVPYEVATPYTAANLARLQYTQSGDVLALTHPSYAPRELTRVAHTSWTLEEVTFAALEPFFRDVDSPYTATLKPHVLDLRPDGTAYDSSDTSHPPQEWTYKVTVVAQDEASGRKFETLPATVEEEMPGGNVAVPPSSPVATELAIYQDRAITLRRPTTGGLIAQPDGYDTFKALAFNVYRGRGNLFGFIGQTTARDFVDVGQEPDYSIQPPLGQNPFEVYDDTGTLVRTEYPAALAYFQERRVYAGTSGRPGYLFFSAVGAYKNFDQYDLAPAGSALVFDLLSRKRQDIRHLLEFGRLLAFTNSAVWSLRGHEGEPLDASPGPDFKQVEEIGSSYLAPLLVDGGVLYARTKGRGVRAILPGQHESGYRGVDLSVIAEHLFLGQTFQASPLFEDSFLIGSERTRELVDWAYQEDPFGLVWAVREDGVLLSLTFSPADGSWGWARHDTDGEFLNVCAVPEGDEDAVYLAVKRTINGDTKYYLERMRSRVRKGSPNDDAAVDCGLTYEGTPTTTITGLDHLEGEEVWAVCFGNAPKGPYTVSGGQIELDEEPESFFEYPSDTEFVAVHVGLLFTPELETLDVANAAVRNRQKTVTGVGIEVDQSIGLHVGQDFEHLKEWRQRTVADDFNAISAATELVRVPVSGTWNESARAALRQSLPLPVTVLGITRELDVGDR